MQDIRDIERIAVIGAGLIGSSWAALAMGHGLNVSAYDPAPGAEEKFRHTVERARERLEGNRKRFATEFAMALSPLQQGMAFSLFQGADPVETVRAVIGKNLQSGPRVDEVRALFGGLRWEDFYVEPIDMNG